MNVLISSAGRRVELLRCFQSDAIELGMDLTLFATDANPKLSAACHLADRALSVPRCDSPEFIPKLLDICESNRISLLVPTIDPELQLLSASKMAFSKIGTLVAISEPETVNLCRNKDLTATQLAAHKLPVPRTVAFENLTGSGLHYPIVLKPRGGSSSREIIKIQSEQDLGRVPAGLTLYIAQELCSGPEYTVNLFFDQNHELRVAVPHLRIETRTGEVSKGRTERNAELIGLAHRLEATLPGAFGPLCFQAILTEDGPVIFEINARFGGGYPLAHHAGAKFTKWLLEWAGGLPSSIGTAWEDNLTMLRYDQSVFCQANV